MRAMIMGAAFVLAATTMAARPAAASDETDVLAVVNDYNAALNKGDIAAAGKDSGDQLSIIDEFAVYHWQGPAALAGWAGDYAAWAKANSVTPGLVALGKPWHVEISGEHAYAVIPATYTYVKAGAKVVEDGSVWTFALEKSAAGWRIVSWAWGER